MVEPTTSLTELIAALESREVSARDLLAVYEADAWLITYNHQRRNHGDNMAGRRPIDLLELPS